ncbi:MAG TPA: hypothetical protein VJ732_06135, partial [Bryobacteraceae bacterium]|nr:hypothetical protein [Bryobacteraceae bacterium]
MSRSLFPRLAAALLAAAGVLAAQAPARCDRSCLEGFVNQYLEAMVARNPFGLPWAREVKFSENEQVLPVGEGLWKTASGPGTYKIYVSDPQAGEAGFLGTLRENGRP